MAKKKITIMPRKARTVDDDIKAEFEAFESIVGELRRLRRPIGLERIVLALVAFLDLDIER